jgi:multiple sugar transport system substrate-binding protein
MQQAGYSPADLAGMTAAFEQANPNIKVNNTLVAYEALHDKIVAAAPAGTYDVVLGDVIWPAEFGSKGIVRDITDKVNSLPINQIFPAALVMAKYQDKCYGMPWILDTKYVFVNRTMLNKAGVNPSQLKTWDDVVAALKKVEAKGIVKYPWQGSVADTTGAGDAFSAGLVSELDGGASWPDALGAATQFASIIVSRPSDDRYRPELVDGARRE